MRNGQNERMRGRNRKGQNPLTRVYESNGPDVKIRGTASHVAEKYIQLARDAQTSGDPVAAEGYFQHAEHYFRLIAAAQEQFRQSQPYYRPEGERREDNPEEVDDEQPGESPFGREPQAYSPRDSQPYSRSQITQLLRETWFTPTGWDEALYVPPIPRKWFLRSAIAWERTGAALWAPFAGVHIVDASKQVYRAIPARRERRRLVPALDPVLAPSPGGVPG